MATQRRAASARRSRPDRARDCVMGRRGAGRRSRTPLSSLSRRRSTSNRILSWSVLKRASQGVERLDALRGIGGTSDRNVQARAVPNRLMAQFSPPDRICRGGPTALAAACVPRWRDAECTTQHAEPRTIVRALGRGCHSPRRTLNGWLASAVGRALRAVADRIECHRISVIHFVNVVNAFVDSLTPAVSTGTGIRVSAQSIPSGGS